ncbi:hypothetical protein B6K85_08465 [Vibrio sp. V1B]|nr:hypothetical protein B6K85_08465 [Vibrio sp. V1B]
MEGKLIKDGELCFINPELHWRSVVLWFFIHYPSTQYGSDKSIVMIAKVLSKEREATILGLRRFGIELQPTINESKSGYFGSRFFCTLN